MEAVSVTGPAEIVTAMGLSGVFALNVPLPALFVLAWLGFAGPI